MADKPSRSLVVYGDGYAALLDQPSLAAATSNLHSFASLASCGFLPLRSSASANNNTEDNRAIQELAQLLDAYGPYAEMKKEGNQESAVANPNPPFVSKLSERFMGLRAAIFTSCHKVSSFASSLGFVVFQMKDLFPESDSSHVVLPKDINYSDIVSTLFGLLGFSCGIAQEVPEFDLVFIHLSTEKTRTMKAEEAGKTDLYWLNKLVGQIIDASPCGSAIASRLHLSIILSYGTFSKQEDQCSLISNSLTECNSDLSLLRPHQSYTINLGNPLDDVRHHHPMLLAQWQDGVTRRDLVTHFSFDEFIKYGGNLAILAERFLHEVAFKLWKAPKYGA